MGSHGIAMKMSRGSAIGLSTALPLPCWHVLENPMTLPMEQFQRHGTCHWAWDGTAVGQFHGNAMGAMGFRGVVISFYELSWHCHAAAIDHGTAVAGQ